ncbi:MAG: UbiA family prenyltransferase [Desulforhopalus sp.]
MNDATTSPDGFSKLHHAEGEQRAVPLAVDLDGTLINTDSLMESIMLLLKTNPLFLGLLFIWLVKGRAYFKQQVAQRVTLDISSLPYHLDVLSFLREQHQSRRTLVLTTGADQYTAQQIADYLHVFDRVIASDGNNNLTGVRKKERLEREFGTRGFDYLGNHDEDLPVWQAARQTMVVGSQTFIDRIHGNLSNIERVFVVKARGWQEWIRVFRLHHWLKNLLVFVPLMAAHRFHEITLLLPACLAFFSFCLCTSSVYILNDLLDLPDDRRHPRKRLRPFASGKVPLHAGFIAAPLLLGASLVVGLILPATFVVMLGIYYTITFVYSFRLKKIVILDVIILATLFTVRMIAGSAATQVWPSSWLLAHSMFLFISLALVKRYAELVTMRNEHGQAARARSYVVSDSELLAAMGVASAFVSVLVLVLYITSGTAQQLYGNLNVIWLACPALLYWLCYIWLIAHRGGMHDDPMIFALKDPVSRYILLSMVVIMFLAI